MMQEDLYYPQSFLQEMFWKCVHILSENILNRWPCNKLIRQKALRTTMELLHYQDEASRYFTGGCVPKVKFPQYTVLVQIITSTITLFFDF